MISFIRHTPRTVLLLFFFAVSFELPRLTAWQIVPPPITTTVNNIRPGVVHKRIVDERGPWIINLVEIDLSYHNLDIVSARAMDRLFGRERTSSIAERLKAKGRNVIAAINADFFSLRTGENENNQIADGVVVKGTKMTGSPFDTFDNIHSQFGLTWMGKPVLDRFEFSGSVRWQNGHRIEIHGVNDVPKSTSLVLHNSQYGSRTPTDTLGMEIRELDLSPLSADLDTIPAVVTSIAQGGGMTIRPNSLVLSGYNLPSSHILSKTVPGDTLTIILDFAPGPAHLKTLIGGWPRIVRDGMNVGHVADSLEGTFPRFSAGRHPRSGVGFAKDSTKVYFVVVDGRQQESVGMALVEFGDLMLSLGIFQGLNFDGGGSTTLVVNGTIVNSPSDATGERPVGNCLLLIHRSQ